MDLRADCSVAETLCDMTSRHWHCANRTPCTICLTHICNTSASCRQGHLWAEYKQVIAIQHSMSLLSKHTLAYDRLVANYTLKTIGSAQWSQINCPSMSRAVPWTTYVSEILLRRASADMQAPTQPLIKTALRHSASCTSLLSARRVGNFGIASVPERGQSCLNHLPCLI